MAFAPLVPSTILIRCGRAGEVADMHGGSDRARPTSSIGILRRSCGIARLIDAALLATIIVFLRAPLALGAPLAVTPTQIFLSPHQQSDLLSITNENDVEARYQIETFAWQQKADGESDLKPTQDVIVFPPLLALAPHETRRVRVAVTAASPADLEKSYRLTIQELPGGPKANASGQIQVLTKLSLPVFIEPITAKSDAVVQAEPLEGGVMRFLVRNTGTVHFVLRKVSVAGLEASGAKVFEAASDGWYVLPGGERDYRIALAAGECARSSQLVITALIDDSAKLATVATNSKSCGAGLKTRYLGAAEAR